MNLHLKSPGDRPGVYPIARRGRELKYLSFTIVELGAGMPTYELDTGDEEVALNFYKGPVRVEAEGGWTADIGQRRSLADEAPMVYAPAGSRLRIAATNGPARFTIAGAEGKRPGSPVLVGYGDAVSKVVGKDNWTRTVHTHIADNIPAEHLICGETINRPGGWSSCPPHKHDVFNAPSEVPMEEVYYFQVEPAQGFGFMRVYTDPASPEPFDYAYAIEHGDTVLIPRGYHPVVACPGYTVNYAWYLAGEGRTYGAWSDDPRHAWIKG